MLRWLFFTALLVIFVACSSDDPHVVHYCLVHSNALLIRVEAQKLISGSVVPRTPQSGDKISEPEQNYAGDNGSGRWIYQGELLSGTIIGPAIIRDGQNYTKEFDSVVGAKLDEDWADSTTSYYISSVDDSDYFTPVHPSGVLRKTKLNSRGTQSAYWDDSLSEKSSRISTMIIWTSLHDITLLLPSGCS